MFYFQFPWQKVIFFSFCISFVCFDGLLFSEQRFSELALAIYIIRNYSINFYIFLELALKALVLFLIRDGFFTFIDCIILFMLCYLYIIFKSVFMWSPERGEEQINCSCIKHCIELFLQHKGPIQKWKYE